MRDDHLKQIEELKDKTITTNEQLDDIITSSPTLVYTNFLPMIFTFNSSFFCLLVNNK